MRLVGSGELRLPVIPTCLSPPFFCPCVAVVIGDGVTDMQARPPAQLFIGYGGVVQREPVMEGADLYVTDLQVPHPRVEAIPYQHSLNNTEYCILHCAAQEVTALLDA